LSVNTSKTTDKPTVKLPVIIAAAVAVVIFLGWYGRQIFSPTANVTNELTDKHDAWMQMIAKEAGPNADLEKLTPEHKAAFLKSLSGAPVDPKVILKDYITHHPVH